MKEKLKSPLTILLFLTLLGAILRFYKLDWGDGQFFHPDERNIVFGISNLHIENLKDYFSAIPPISTYPSILSWLKALPLKDIPLNPKFWAYGSLPIYIIYFIAKLLELVGVHSATTFEGYIIIGRFLSALSSTALIPLTYLLTVQTLNKHKYKHFIGLVSAFWITFMPGMLQFAHFMTFETFLTLQYMVILLISFYLVKTGQKKYYILLGILFGISIGTKIISIALLPILFLAHALWIYNQKASLNIFKFFTSKFLLSLLLIPIFAFLSSPFHILDWGGFMNSLTYESSVANGSLLVFYTQQFIDTIPVFYQITRVFPYILSIPLTIIAVVALVYFLIASTTHALRAIYNKKRVSSELSFLLLLLAMLVLYLGFHFTLYVKWTRYMIPALPFLSILSALLIFTFVHYSKKLTKAIVLVTSLWLLFAGMMFWQIYTNKYTVMEAANIASTKIPKNVKITSEVYDLGAIPFNPIFGTQNIELLNVYELEHDPYANDIFKKRDESDYYLILSQRLYGTRFRIPEKFPLGYKFYDEIIHGSNWTKVLDVNRTSAHCNIFTLMCLGGYFNPDETFVVFYHPEVMMYSNLNK